MVWLAYMAAMRRSSSSKLSISVMVLHPISRTSSGAESSLPAIYDSRRVVFSGAFSNIVLVEGPSS